MRKFSSTLAIAGAGLLLSSSVGFAGYTADSVVDYTAGDLTGFPSEKTYTTPGAALGPLNGDTGYGGLNPFNPAFSNSQLVAVGAGGQLTLHLAAGLSTAGGASLGVFSNNGLDDVSQTGTGLASKPAVTFDDPDHPEAIVSVSSDGTHYVQLNSGNPIVFSNPANYYLDQELSGYYENLGSSVANQFKPFTGSLSDFDGKTFDDIRTILNGSAGGNWLDLSGTGLATVNDVRFNVPAGASYSLVVDSVSEVPEPVVGLPLLAGALLVRRNRRRR